MPWKPFRLRDADVWAKIDEAGELLTDDDGRVAVVYKAGDGAKVYRAGAKNLAPREGAIVDFAAGGAAAGESPAQKSGGAGATAVGEALPSNAIAVWTDGGCAPNPGPGAIGMLVIDGGKRHERGEYLGESTNNICELTAIMRGLQMIDDPARPVVVYADSAYAIGLLSKGWKAKANVELVGQLRALCKRFSNLRFVKVPAHSGVADNERVDQLVNMARAARGTVGNGPRR